MDKKRLTEMLKQHGVKVIGNYVRKDDLRKVLGAGEMSKKDLEPGGEYHEAAKLLQEIASRTGLFKEVKPFDTYQGPFALLTNGDRIWFGEGDDYYFVEQKGGRVFELDADDLESLYTSEKKALERRSKFKLVKSKFEAQRRVIKKS